jgi:hypothetical protein
MNADRRRMRQPLRVALAVAAVAGIAAPLQAAASREMLVSVQVVRRCAVNASALSPQDGEARVSFQTTCGNAERVMVELSGRPSSLEPTGEPLYLQTPSLLQTDSPERAPTTVLTVNF